MTRSLECAVGGVQLTAHDVASLVPLMPNRPLALAEVRADRYMTTRDAQGSPCRAMPNWRLFDLLQSWAITLVNTPFDAIRFSKRKGMNIVELVELDDDHMQSSHVHTVVSLREAAMGMRNYWRPTL
jgi:hypothetical protein